MNFKKFICIMVCQFVIASALPFVVAQADSPETLLKMDVDNMSDNIGEFQVTKTGTIGTKKAYEFSFHPEANGTLFYLPWIRSEDNMDTTKKYIYHAKYYPDFDTPTGYIEGLYLNVLGTEIDGLSVTPKTNSHPSQNDYRYYSYYYKNDYTDLYTTGFFNGLINEDLSASGNGVNVGWPWKTNEIVLKTKEWNTFEIVLAKPKDSKFEIHPYVHEKYNNGVEGKSLYADDICLQELALNKINLIKNDNLINDKTVKTKRNSTVSFSADVYNQFDTVIGFKDRNDRVMEPLKFEIYDKNNNLISTSSYGEVPTNQDIYVETEINSYKLKAPKDSREKWDTPTYRFKLITSPKVEIGEYKVIASLLNKDIFGSEKTAVFNLDVLSEYSYTSDETEPDTLLWLIGDDEENKVGSDLKLSVGNGKNETTGYVFEFSESYESVKVQNITSVDEKTMNTDKKYIYYADYYTNSTDTSDWKISINGIEEKFNIPQNEWYSYEKIIDTNNGEGVIASHIIPNDKSEVVYADNIRMQELSVSQINFSDSFKAVTRNHEFDIKGEILNQFGTETGFLDEYLEFKVYSSVGNLIGESKYIDGENVTSGNITISKKTGNKYTVNVSSETVSDTYIVKASLLNKAIHNSELVSSFEVKVTKEKDYPKGSEYPETLLWANGDDAYLGHSLGTPVYNKGINGTNAYKQSFQWDNGYYYLKPFPVTTMKTNPAKKYIYHADYYVDFETANGETTQNWMLWSSASEDGLRVTEESGEHPSNKDYRYYSYYPGFTGTDVYIKGVFNGTINEDLSMKDMGWMPSSNMFVLKQKEWTTYEALVSKQEYEKFSVYGLFGNSADDVVGKPVYIDNVAFQELALSDIEIFKGEDEISGTALNVKRGEKVSLTGEVYNQFNTTLGFKDRDGRVMEPLRFIVYDENENIISDNKFSIENQKKDFGISFETRRNEYNLLAPKNGMDKWVYPTYDFTLNVSEEIPCGNYKVEVKLQNEDIFGSEKITEFDVIVSENASAKDFEIFGESEILLPKSDEKTISYTQITGNNAVWSLDDVYSGISVSQEGIMTIETTADEGTVNLICQISENGKKYVSSKRIELKRETTIKIDGGDLPKVKISDFDYFDFQRIMGFFGKDGKFIRSEIIPKDINNYETEIDEETKSVNLYIWDDNMKPYSSVLKATTENLPVNIYVATYGNDENDGTLERPLKTIEKARDKAREIKAQIGYPKNGINIIIRGGEYRFTTPLELEKCDSGTENAPILYKAYGDEKVTFTGGDILPADKWSLTTDEAVLSKIPSNAHGKVYELDLGALGYTADSIGQMNYWGIFAIGNNQSNTPNVAPPAELYCDDEPQIIARYPNDDYIYIKTVYEKGAKWYEDKSKELPFEIGYEDLRTERWLDAKYAKLFGYWVYDYAESSVDISKIDTAKKSITVKQTTAFGVKAHEPDKIGGRYFILNLLEELDSPGEYYTDLDTMKIYYYPKGDISESKLVLSVSDRYLLYATNVSNVTFQNIRFSDVKGEGLWIGDCNNFNIKGCEVCNMGARGITIWEGKNNSVSDSRIYNLNGGIYLRSYDGRENLIKSNNSAVNNEIYNFARSTRSSMPAITVDGCGNYIAKNTIHQGPHEAIWLLGANDNIVEYNELYDLLNDTSDAGAIYCGMDWTQRGNVIRYNHIYDLGEGQANIQGIYLDGTVSGYEIYGNIVGGYFGNGIYVNGGSDVSVRNNILYDCGVRGVLMSYVPNMSMESESLSQFDTIASSPYRNDIWKERYPNLYNITETNPYLPKYTIANNNIAINCASNDIHDVVKELGVVEDIVNVSSEQVSVFDENGKLNPDFEAIKAYIPGFEKIDISNIGSTIKKKH